MILRAAGVLGPFGSVKSSRAAGSSKAFTKEICDAANAPTQLRPFTDALGAGLFGRPPCPIVIKADMACSGQRRHHRRNPMTEALARSDTCLTQPFGDAGGRRWLSKEFHGRRKKRRFFVLGDGPTPCCPSALAQDHKRVGDGDTGRTRAGMGCLLPSTRFDRRDAERALAEIIRPTMVPKWPSVGHPTQGCCTRG